MVPNAVILRLTVLAMLAMALLMVYSAGAAVGNGSSSVGAILGSRHVAYALVALTALWLGSRVDLRRFAAMRGRLHPVVWVTVLAVGLTALALIPGLGPSINGARRWLWVGPRSWSVTFQPSELVKWVVPIALAYWCTRRSGMMHRFVYGLLPAILLTGLACGLVLIEDLGTAVLIGLVSIAVLWAGGARLRQMALFMAPALLMLIVAVAHSPYRVKRLTSFLHPWSDGQGVGYQAIQSMLAIAEGGLTGRGLGNGVQKFGHLPADTSDFLFAVICEETGLLGAVLVVGLYLTLLWIGLAAIRGCTDMFGRLVGLGILLTIGCQAVMNIAVVTVIVPTKGIGLPLLSAGGTGWILTALAIGLLASLDRPEQGAGPSSTLSSLAARPSNTAGPPLVSSAR